MRNSRRLNIDIDTNPEILVRKAASSVCRPQVRILFSARDAYIQSVNPGVVKLLVNWVNFSANDLFDELVECGFS